ncbi:hypothetical protein JIN85_08355 [Luteolibacter pohnpeiensis]|uniref:Uncharacterized protein n=1 Tax=Luteolibacter pohnpeiensis TaxID=454153 RepID=A0A934SBU2_9BACT|nr:hypothetical protein [Luteolibacter pohnpeiensis]MBK1882423.1 hypothetical protein [Luteolibacter pohnpeiensis]
MNGRYFEGDYPELVDRLESHFRRVRESWDERKFDGSLVLGGGYGRGEGGVMKIGEKVEFSNDLDYFLFNPNPTNPELLDWAKRIEREETDRLGIDVEIKCLTEESVGDPQGSMMFSDLIAGNEVVAGDASFLQKLPARLDFSKIGAEEATRLLWNRGSGLFFAGCRMNRADQLGYVIRNHAKAKLALGDAWLCLNGQYHPQCRERGARLQKAELADALGKLKAWHLEGVEFKFNPVCTGISWETLEQERNGLIKAWAEVYLMAESARLSKSIPDFATYLSLPRVLPAYGICKNLALAARDRLKRGAFLRPLGDYPRGALMRALPCLLGQTDGGVSEAARFLPISTGSDMESTYARWWAYYA